MEGYTFEFDKISSGDHVLDDILNNYGTDILVDKYVLDALGVTLEELRENSRKKPLSDLRFIYIYMLNLHTDWSQERITTHVKKENRTSILHGIRTVENWIHLYENHGINNVYTTKVFRLKHILHSIASKYYAEFERRRVYVSRKFGVESAERLGEPIITRWKHPNTAIKKSLDERRRRHARVESIKLDNKQGGS